MWFENEKRELPWRVDLSAYAVWVSEVMLQQTQVSVVIPYFERWMIQFPKIESLANASQESVIKAWEGLGYYSRARSLHEGARYVVNHHQGVFPHTEEELSQIKGLGPYTIGAIRSFAFHQRAAAVDGNVMRVLSRYFLIQEDISKTKTIKELRKIALQILPEHESWIVNEALIELGATVCSKKPKCSHCPLKPTCKGFSKGLTDSLPIKTKQTKTEVLYRAVAVIFCEDFVLLKRGKAGEIMQDLYEFPYFESIGKDLHLSDYMHEWSSLDIKYQSTIEPISHSFTRYRVSLFPKVFSCVERKVIKDCFWIPMEGISELPFSSGHRKVCGALKNI